MKSSEGDTIPDDVLADAQAVIDSQILGKPLAPEIAERIHQRAQAIKEKVFAEHGLLDIGVPAIRELRDS